MRNILVILAALLIVGSAGCGTFTVAPGSDPVVVYAEASAELALDTFDSFLKWERDNDATLRMVDPSIHKVANEIRDNGLRWIVELRDATKAYKASRTEPNRTKLQMAQQFLDLAIAELRAAMAKGQI